MTPERGSDTELVDVVDADDRVVARVTRAEIRRRNLFHRAVYVLVINRAGQIFVHRRTATKDVFPGYWDMAIGGVVAAGEDYAGAAERELREELGVDRGALEDAGAMRYADAATQILGRVFVTRLEGPFVLQPEEIVEGRFMSFDDVERLIDDGRCCPDSVHVWRTYRTGAPSDA